MRILRPWLTAVCALIIVAVGLEPAFCDAATDPATFSETEILNVIARKPFDVTFSSAASHGGEIFFATSGGLVAFDPQTPAARLVIRDPVRSAAPDPLTNRWVAGGEKGLWREDIGWFYPMGFDFPGVEQVTATPAGILLTTKTDLWLLRSDQAIHLFTDTRGIFGVPAATTEEVAVIGFWAVHRLAITDLSMSPAGRISASGAPSAGVSDAGRISVREIAVIPLPAEFRADVPLGVCFVGRSLLVIGRRTGITILSPNDRIFPPAIPPPPLDQAHIERGFPDGWTDFAVDADELYLITSAARLYHLSLGRPLRLISRWPQLSQPYRLAVWNAREFVLFPHSGNHVLVADPSVSGIPRKFNFLISSSGEILVRPGLAPGLFTHRSRLEWFNMAAGWALLGAGVCGFMGWSFFNGIPILYRFHPHASVFYERLITFRRDQTSLLQSFLRTEKELQRMKSALNTQSARLQVMTETKAALKESLLRFVQNALEEGRRIRMEGGHARPSSGRHPSIFLRFLRRQTRGWEREFRRIAIDTQRMLEKIDGPN